MKWASTIGPMESIEIAVEAQLHWAYEQGMSKKQWTVEAMFHPSTMTWYR
jgi:hypothetical protein